MYPSLKVMHIIILRACNFSLYRMFSRTLRLVSVYFIPIPVA